MFVWFACVWFEKNVHCVNLKNWKQMSSIASSVIVKSVYAWVFVGLGGFSWRLYIHTCVLMHSVCGLQGTVRWFVYFETIAN